MQWVYRGWLHIILTYLDDEEFFKNQIVSVLGEDVAMEYKKLLVNNFWDWIEVTVQAGSLLPDDKIYQAEQAKALYLKGKIATETAFERMWIKNPKEEADKLALEATENKIKSQKLLQMASQEQASAEQAQQEMWNIHQEIQGIGEASPEEQINKAIESIG